MPLRLPPREVRVWLPLPNFQMKAIPLTNGGVTLIDDEDFEMVSKLKWYWMKTPSVHKRYVASSSSINNKTRMISLHRMLMGFPKGKLIDHKNGDTLDNRKCNLRVCSNAENSRNRRKITGCSSRFKGVHWDKKCKKWHAKIKRDGKTRSLGFFDDEEAAARAYNVAAPLFHGEFAYLNPL